MDSKNILGYKRRNPYEKEQLTLDLEDCFLKPQYGGQSTEREASSPRSSDLKFLTTPSEPAVTGQQRPLGAREDFSDKNDRSLKANRARKQKLSQLVQRVSTRLELEKKELEQLP